MDSTGAGSLQQGKVPFGSSSSSTATAPSNDCPVSCMSVALPPALGGHFRSVVSRSIAESPSDCGAQAYIGHPADVYRADLARDGVICAAEAPTLAFQNCSFDVAGKESRVKGLGA